MYKLFLWLVFLLALFFAYKAGWFNSIVNYFVETDRYSKQEKVIENPDGSVTSVRYRNIIDIVTGK